MKVIVLPCLYVSLEESYCKKMDVNLYNDPKAINKWQECLLKSIAEKPTKSLKTEEVNVKFMLQVFLVRYIGSYLNEEKAFIITS